MKWKLSYRGLLSLLLIMLLYGCSDDGNDVVAPADYTDVNEFYVVIDNGKPMGFNSFQFYNMGPAIDKKDMYQYSVTARYVIDGSTQLRAYLFFYSYNSVMWDPGSYLMLKQDEMYSQATGILSSVFIEYADSELLGDDASNTMQKSILEAGACSVIKKGANYYCKLQGFDTLQRSVEIHFIVNMSMLNESFHQ